VKDYAGIGSRSVPEQIYDLMIRVASWLAQRDYCLLSGGASGSDTAFETGCDNMNGNKEIYLPWDNFQRRKIDNVNVFDGVDQLSLATAKSFHPAWHRCSGAAQRLMARNTYQVLDRQGLPRIKFLMCWTIDGSSGITTQATGGTGQAIRIAHHHGIPIFNLELSTIRQRVEEKISK
jgi:hypothetical protein